MPNPSESGGPECEADGREAPRAGENHSMTPIGRELTCRPEAYSGSAFRERGRGEERKRRATGVGYKLPPKS